MYKYKNVSKEIIKKLEKEQLELSKKLSLIDKKNINEIKYIAGIDTTFTDIWSDKTTAISAITVLEYPSLEEIETVFAVKEIDFPYIPTFLAYRELPVILEAYKKLNTKPDVFFIDGMGILHPRKMGIASHFGVITGEVSIGIGKSKLVGDFKEPENKPSSYNPIYVDGELRGYILRSRKNSNPIFISPGNNISVNSALKLTINTLKRYKLPEPTRLAHNKLQIYRKNYLGGKHW